MALLHRADLHPTKLELLAGWLPGRPWYQGHPGADVVRVAAFRFDDPAGAVGIETILVQVSDGVIHQVPLTYRGAPMAGSDDWLVGTADHSVLGKRWVYDGCADPVYAAALASAILAGTAQAEEYFEVEDRLERRDPSMMVTGSGQDAAAKVPAIDSVLQVADHDPTIIMTDAVELAVVRCVMGKTDPPGDALTGTLTGTWSGQASPVTLAYATTR
jgi:hypothetical protein